MRLQRVCKRRDGRKPQQEVLGRELRNNVQRTTEAGQFAPEEFLERCMRIMWHWNIFYFLLTLGDNEITVEFGGRPRLTAGVCWRSAISARQARERVGERKRVRAKPGVQSNRTESSRNKNIKRNPEVEQKRGPQINHFFNLI